MWRDNFLHCLLFGGAFFREEKLAYRYQASREISMGEKMTGTNDCACFPGESCRPNVAKKHWKNQKSREGGPFAKGAVAQICRKLRKIAGISFRASEEGVRKIVANLKVIFRQFYANTPFSNAPFLEFSKKKKDAFQRVPVRRFYLPVFFGWRMSHHVMDMEMPSSPPLDQFTYWGRAAGDNPEETNENLRFSERFCGFLPHAMSSGKKRRNFRCSSP